MGPGEWWRQPRDLGLVYRGVWFSRECLVRSTLVFLSFLEAPAPVASAGLAL